MNGDPNTIQLIPTTSNNPLPYHSDRAFTDYVHQHLALPHIYAKLGWEEQWLQPTLLAALDRDEGVDYLFEDKGGNTIKVQERFRDSYAKAYTDCTLRYRRDLNTDPSRHLSEFFKIKADYLVYGITGGSKFLEQRATLTGFHKWAVINIVVLMQAVKEERIVLRQGGIHSRIEGGKLIAPIIPNRDPSSTFIAFDVQQLEMLFGSEGIVPAQQGYW